MNSRGRLQPWLALVGLFAMVALPLDSAAPERLIPRDGVFGWAVHRGQFEDLEREGERILEPDRVSVDDRQGSSEGKL